jgi:phosphonate transport system permease protein
MNPTVNEPAHANDWREGRARLRLKLRRLTVPVVMAAALILCWRAAEIRPSALFADRTIASVWVFLRGLFPPDLSPEFLRIVIVATGRTLAMAIAGTALSIVIGLPLGMLATATLYRRGVLLAGEPKSAGQSLLSGFSRAIRALLGFLRAVPDLMWGLLFVVAVGLGSLAGTLALAVSYCGVLGRVYADVFEHVDPRPLEALHATGATRVQVFLRAIWPQAAPGVIAYTLYSFECCVRAAAVLGFIGAGGIGYEINLSMRLFEYGQVFTLIAAFIVLVAATDALSRFLRQRLRANAPLGSLAHQHLENGGSFRQRRLRLPERVTGGKLAALLMVAAALSFYASGFFTGALIDPELFKRVARFIGALFPPESSLSFLRSLVGPLYQTIGISVMGTLIGIAIGSVLSLPATSTLVYGEAEGAGRRSVVSVLGRRAIYTAARLILTTLRSIPELIWVLLCILAVGLGPFSGTVAIGLHTGGVLGKLYAETFEEVPPQPIEALRGGGASVSQILLWGIWPQARPMLASYTVLRWEMNLRVSTILGLVGGGGLGQAIYNNIQLGFYPRVTTLVLIVYLLVIATDWVSDRLRNR